MNKTVKILAVTAAVIALPTIGFVACTAAAGSAIESASAPAAVTYAVEVEGGRGSVTYADAGGIVQNNDTTFPFRKDVQLDGFAVPTLTAQKSTGGPGEISCTITKDGIVVAESASSGPYAVVSCA